jgi:hypothetical protein
MLRSSGGPEPKITIELVFRELMLRGVEFGLMLVKSGPSQR